jgi:hypothetical protein
VELANNIKLAILMCFVLNSQSTFSKTYDILLDINPLTFPVDHLVEADEFVLRMALGSGLFFENLEGQIKPNIAKDPQFNPVNGRVQFSVNKQKKWSNGAKITSSDILYSLTQKNENSFKKKFLDCVHKNAKGITIEDKLIKFKWNIKDPKCGNPYALLSHQSTFIFQRNNSKSLRKYLVDHPLSSAYKVSFISANEIQVKSIKNDTILRFIFNRKQIKNKLLYRRLDSIITKIDTKTLLNVGYSQTVSFESTGLNKQEITSLECLRDKIYTTIKNENEAVIKAYSYSLHTSLALGVIPTGPTKKNCKPINKTITLSRSFNNEISSAIKVIKDSGFKINVIDNSTWKNMWFNEKLPLTMRLQKVRTNNIYSLFFSYFQSGISPYKRITDEISKIDKKSILGGSKNGFIRAGLNSISSKGYIVPIIHLPTLIETTVECAKAKRGDIYFDFDEFLRGCNEANE